MLSTHALYSFNVEVPSKIALLAGADSPSKFLWFKIDLPLTSYFFYFFHFSWLSLFPHRPPRAVLFPSSFLEGFPPSSSFVFSFFFPLFPMLFWLLSFFLLKIRNDERKTFLLRFRFSFLLFEKKERKKAERDRAYVLSPLLLKGGKGCVLFSLGWWKWCCLDGNKTIRNNSVVNIIINQIF